MQLEVAQPVEMDTSPVDRLEFPAPRRPMRMKAPRSGLSPEPLQPTRSGRSLQNRASVGGSEDSAGRPQAEGRQQRREATEIASLKAQLQNHDTLQSQWKIAQQELATQKQARASDAARMAEQVALLEVELGTASSEAVQAFVSVSKQRNLWRAVAAIAGVAALGFLCAGLRAPGRPVATTAAGSAMKEAGPSLREPELFANPLPQDPPAALTIAFDRLNDALERVPGLSPEDALRKVSGEGSGCGIVWNDHLPAVVFGLKSSRPNPLASTLEDCAEAVARFH